MEMEFVSKGEKKSLDHFFTLLQKGVSERDAA